MVTTELTTVKVVDVALTPRSCTRAMLLADAFTELLLTTMLPLLKVAEVMRTSRSGRLSGSDGALSAIADDVIEMDMFSNNPPDTVTSAASVFVPFDEASETSSAEPVPWNEIGAASDDP